MADPVTLAMVGAAAGAITNKKDPVKGALLGAAMGGAGGLIAAPAAGAAAVTNPALAGIAPMGAEAAGLLSAAPAAASGPGVGAILGSKTASAASSPSLLSKLVTPGTLMAGNSLLGAMNPPPVQTAPGQVVPGQPVPLAFQGPQITQRPMQRDQLLYEDIPQGMFAVPPLMFETQGPGGYQAFYNPGRTR